MGLNECVFLSETLVIILFSFLALKLGKEALISWITLQAIIANLFIVKQIDLLGLQVTATDAFAIGSLLSLNFLQEFFGPQISKKASWICFASLAFFALISQLHLLFQPSSSDTTQSAFQTILSPSLRVFTASMVVFFIVQQVDIRIFSFLKGKLTTASFALRSTLSLLLSQTLDTFLFSFVGLYGLVTSLCDIILVSLIIKWIVISCFTVSLRVAKL